ncbi:polymorphic toxin-type HINT domain-containing protein, partial [Streptomyces sp. PR69]|uniref:polymorphic toxin-type HINT domain-containing protein n=1 Tax=Streptomyces sp. PR69 TaxID=2984950 RepID=UPI00226429FF
DGPIGGNSANDSAYMAERDHYWSGGPGKWNYNDRDTTVKTGPNSRTTVTVVKTYGADPKTTVDVKQERLDCTSRKYGAGCQWTSRDTADFNMEEVHLALDAAGFVPGLGAVPDVANAILYTFEGNFSEAGWSLVAAIPVWGDGVAATRKGTKLLSFIFKKCPTKHSFVAGTEVLLADGTSKPIEDLKAGDQVLATDPETGETSGKAVTATILTEDDKTYVDLTIASPEGSDTITTTDHHPFWSESEQAWLDAGTLKPGMTLRTDEGNTATVQAARTYTAHQTTYNLTVADLHTYYVLAGKTPVLVHNSGGCPDLDALSQSGMRAAKGKTTHAGREYQKHMNRGDLPVVPGKELKTAGQDLLDDILTNPQTTRSAVNSGNFAGGTRYIMPDPAGGRGIGATFDANGQFQYFGRY